MLAHQDNFLVLIISLYLFYNQPKPRLLMIRLTLNLHIHPDRIPDKYRPDKTQPLIAIGHRHLIDLSGGKSYCYAEYKSAMRHPPLKRLRLTPLFVHMMREKIAGLTGVNDDIGFCDRTTHRLPALLRLKFFEILLHQLSV